MPRLDTDTLSTTSFPSRPRLTRSSSKAIAAFHSSNLLDGNELDSDGDDSVVIISGPTPNDDNGSTESDGNEGAEHSAELDNNSKSRTSSPENQMGDPALFPPPDSALEDCKLQASSGRMGN